MMYGFAVQRTLAHLDDALKGHACSGATLAWDIWSDVAGDEREVQLF